MEGGWGEGEDGFGWVDGVRARMGLDGWMG